VAVGEVISKYKLELLRVQEVRWNGGGTERAGEYTFFYGKGNDNQVQFSSYIKESYHQLRR
jgi:hypothetical protein